jgi:hypothetical protein
MDPDPNKWKLPVLAVVTGPGINIHGIRELSEEEQNKLAAYTKLAASARNRFKLFTILKRNYSEWWKYTRSLLSPGDDLEPDEMLELDRLMLNFLSSAKSVLDHFKQEWIQAFRKTDKEEDFMKFLKRLEDGCWAFAFFQDLRNFTQHCGLPVGNYSRNTTTSSVTLAIQADSDWLIDHYSRWEKSKLTKAHGRLDLLDLCREYFIRLQQDFGNFVATAFAPNLLEAHNFLAGLANEATKDHPDGIYRIITQLDARPDGLNFQFTTPPSDLLGALGIVVRQPLPAKSEAEQAAPEQSLPAV